MIKRKSFRARGRTGTKNIPIPIVIFLYAGKTQNPQFHFRGSLDSAQDRLEFQKFLAPSKNPSKIITKKFKSIQRGM